MMRLVVLGNATVDSVRHLERLPAVGETVLGQAPMRCAGGKGFNQAVVAARAGACVELIAPIGTDEDARLLRRAAEEEPLERAGWILADAPTDTSSIWVDAAGRNMIASSARCAHGMGAERAAAEATACLRAGDWLLMQGNLPRAATEAAAVAARRLGARVAINAAPAAFAFDDLLSSCDLLVVNEVEAAALSGTDDAIAGARVLACRLDVVLTLGESGAIALASGAEVILPAPRVAVVDSAGAGDVLVGTLVAGLSRGAPMGSALELAVAAASLSVTRPGTSTSFPSSAEIEALRARQEGASGPRASGPLARSDRLAQGRG